MSFFVSPVGTISVPDGNAAMSAPSTRTIPAPTPEQRKIASDNYERAKQVLATGDFDYAIQLLLTCCKLEPANHHFRMTLRKAQKEKYGNNLKGSPLAMFTTPGTKSKMKAAKRNGEYLKVLELGEAVLTKNPWDLGTQTDMAEAFDSLGLLDMAVLTLDQARQKYPKEPSLNRQLARLFEKRGDFSRAIVLWQLVKEAVPTDVEASHKAKDLAASQTIAKGNYEEAAAGTKTSPALDRIESRAVEQQDKVGRDVAALLKRIEAEPTEASLYVQLALAYRKAGQDDRAKAALTQGLGPTGNHFSLRQELLEIELDPLRKKLVVATKRLNAPDGDDDPAWLAEKIKKYTAQIAAKEIDLYRIKIERAPTDGTARLELGTRLISADKIDEAIAELQQARKDEKVKGRAALQLGHAFRKRNNWRLAQRNFEDALASLPENDELSKKDVLFHLAVGAAENGDVPRALDLGHELANIDYGYQGIGTLIETWEGRG
jgi:tetratricopeptide (TPR) repeat protein